MALQDVELRSPGTNAWDLSLATPAAQPLDSIFWIRVDGVWRKTITRIRVNGTWMKAHPVTRVDGEWKFG